MRLQRDLILHPRIDERFLINGEIILRPLGQKMRRSKRFHANRESFRRPFGRPMHFASVERIEMQHLNNLRQNSDELMRRRAIQTATVALESTKHLTFDIARSSQDEQLGNSAVK